MNEMSEAHIPTPERSTPEDIFDASVRSQRGELVDITTLIPIGEYEDEKYSFQNDVQSTFDWIANTMSSPEYAQFEHEVEGLLAEVKGQHFIFDIEGTLMNDVQNLDNLSERVYHVNPHMRVVIMALIENGNDVGFWTSATNDSLEKMRKAMSPEMAGLPSIGREDWEKVVRAFRSRYLNQLEDSQVLDTMQSIYPTANIETFRVGTQIFTEDLLEAFDSNPVYFLRGSKFPQLFLSPENGFLVDDNSDFIDGAVTRGWPESRAIKCYYNPQQRNVTEVAKAISSEAVTKR